MPKIIHKWVPADKGKVEDLKLHGYREFSERREKENWKRIGKIENYQEGILENFISSLNLNCNKTVIFT